RPHPAFLPAGREGDAACAAGPQGHRRRDHRAALTGEGGGLPRPAEAAHGVPSRRSMRRADFSYELPPGLIAQAPLPERSASRLLCLDGATGALSDRHFTDLPDLLQPDDLLVFNDTRVVAARVLGSKPSGGRVEVFLERAVAPDRAWVQLRASKAIRAGMPILTAGGELEVMGRVQTPAGDLWEIRTPG